MTYKEVSTGYLKTIMHNRRKKYVKKNDPQYFRWMITKKTKKYFPKNSKKGLGCKDFNSKYT